MPETDDINTSLRMTGTVRNNLKLVAFQVGLTTHASPKGEVIMTQERQEANYHELMRRMN